MRSFLLQWERFLEKSSLQAQHSGCLAFTPGVQDFACANTMTWQAERKETIWQ